MNLHEQFIQLGRQKIELERKLAALIPQIYEQEIYKKYAGDIYEYCRKYAGLSFGVVQKILRTFKRIQDKPALVQAVEKIGIHKVALVANITTPENQQIVAERIGKMSKTAVAQFAKDFRREQKMVLFGEVNEVVKIELDEEMQFLFNKLKKEFMKKAAVGEMSNREALRKILTEMNHLKFDEKSLKNEVTGSGGKSGDGKETESKTKAGIRTQISESPRPIPGEMVNRNISAVKKRQAIAKTNGKCAVDHCQKPFDHIHHIVPFSVCKSHDLIIPICKEHHEMAHNGLIDIQKNKVEIKNLSSVDLTYRKFHGH